MMQEKNIIPETEQNAVPVLELRNLVVHYETPEGVAEAVNNVSFTVNEAETLGLVGETGAGKTTIALTLMGLLPDAGHVIQGEVLLNGENIVSTARGRRAKKKHNKTMRPLRGGTMGMIFQDPMSALNPVIYVGDQIAEVVRLHNPVSKAEAKQRAVEMMETVGIPGERYSEYPHQFSGGMKQRIVIAMALACNPKVLIADEPTTALDVTIQAQILELLRNLKSQINASIMLITHDLGVIAEMADYVVVMYAGRVVEKGLAHEVFLDPRHPYTIGLMESKPVINKTVDRLYSIPGAVPNPINMPDYCYFRDRCEKCVERCNGQYPHEMHITDTHIVSCWRYFDEDKGGAQNG